MKYNPLYAISNSFLMLILGKVSFHNDRIGKMILRDDGKRFRVFREIQIKAKKVAHQHPTAFFRSGFPPKLNPKKQFDYPR